MSRVPLGAAVQNGPGRPLPKPYFEQYEYTTQFEAAERIADKWGITRADCDHFGLESQVRAGRAWAEGRFEREVVPIDAPDLDDDGKPTGTTHRVERDEGLRETSLEKLATLKPVAREDGVHTAGTSSQITDGAAAVLLTTAGRAKELGLRPRARIVDQCLVGVDPVMMLTGPIDATPPPPRSAPASTMDDFDTVEINEAFASVVLAWERELSPTWQREPQRRRDRARPPGRRHRRPPDHHRAARARAHRRHASASSRCAAAAGSGPARSSSGCDPVSPAPRPRRSPSASGTRPTTSS